MSSDTGHSQEQSISDVLNAPSGASDGSDNTFPYDAVDCSQESIERIRRFLKAQYGIHFPANKLYILRKKLKKRAWSLDVETTRNFCPIIQLDAVA